MEKLVVEQSVQGTTYQPSQSAEAHQIAQLGGFALSFEDLLQRIGARLEHAFSIAEQSAGLLNPKNDTAAEDALRESGSRRDDDRRRRDEHSSDNDVERPGAAADRRDTNSERNITSDTRSDTSQDAGHADKRGNDDHAARDTDGKPQNDSKHERDGDGADTANASGGDAQNDGKGQNDSQSKAETAETTSANAHGNAVQQSVVNQAAAIYVAGSQNKQATDNTRNGVASNSQQGERASEIVQAADAQTQSSGQKKGVHNADTSKRNGKAATQTASGQQAQKAAQGDAGGRTDAVQDQTQKLAKAIGTQTRADVKITVTNEQSQLTSKPTYLAANTSVIARDTGNGTQTGQQQQHTPQQNAQAAQNMQSAQAVAQQQSQAGTPAQGQAAQGTSGVQGAGTGGGATTGTQNAGGTTQHAGGGEGSNNAQSANGGQQSQQTQQTRESLPQQQAQQTQRGHIPSGSVTDQISVKITKALQAGTDRISIQLKPADLGRVDVKLEMTHDGRVMTVVTAEKQDTLDLLRRDSSELQRALADAGLQSGDMEFNLKGQDQQNADGEDNEGKAGNGELADSEDAPEAQEGAVLNAWESGIFINGRLDMRA